MKKTYVIGFCDVGQGIRVPTGIKFWYKGTESNAQKWLKGTMKTCDWDDTTFGGPKLFELKEVT